MQASTQLDPGRLQLDTLSAVNRAYHAISETGFMADNVHRLPVCYQASALIVTSLLENNYRAQHEITTTEGVGEHSYVVVNPSEVDELVIDATWQQFLPDDKVNEDTPKVLVGSRDDIIKRARAYGVIEPALDVWKVPIHGMSIEQQQYNNRCAEAMADNAELEGAWESFMASAD